MSRAARLAGRRLPRLPFKPPVVTDDGYPAVPTSLQSLITAGTIVAGDPITVGAGTHLLYDLVDAPGAGFAGITIAGKMSVDTTKSTRILCDWIEVTATGKHQVASVSARLVSTRQHTISLKGLELNPGLFYCVDQTAGSGPALLQLDMSTTTPPTADQTITITPNGTTGVNVSSNVAGLNVTNHPNGTLFDNRIRFICPSNLTAARTIRVQQKGRTNDPKSRGFIVQPGGQLDWHGAFITRRARLQGTTGSPTFAAGATALTLDAAPSGWRQDHEIGIGTTGFWQFGVGGSDIETSDARTLTATPGSNAITINSGLSRLRYAMKNWYRDTGTFDSAGRPIGELVLFDPGYTKHNADTPSDIDERAWIINRSGNIVFESVDDTEWQTNNLGAVLMVMGRGAIHIDGVEFRRVGQLGRVGRYPVHFHMNSWSMPYGMSHPTDGSYLGPHPDAYVRNCSVNVSKQHGYQLHGVDGVEITNCVTFDVRGHAFNLEDGSEQFNIVTGNVAMRTRGVGTSATVQIKLHELEASGFWITNPKNEFRDNVAVECEVGQWLSPATRCFGLSRDIQRFPASTQELLLADNYAITTRSNSARTAVSVLDELGTTAPGGGFYYPRTGDTQAGVSVVFTIRGYHMYKSGADHYQNRGGFPRYVGFRSADGGRTDFSGSISKGQIENCFGVRTSLNVTPKPGLSTTQRRLTASYHGLLVLQNSLAYGWAASFPADNATGSAFNHDPKISGVEGTAGVMGSDDLYMKGIEMTYLNATGNKLASSSWGAISRQWNFRIQSSGEADLPAHHTTIANAKWDALGFWGPAGNYLIYNHPFYTTGLSSSVPLFDAVDTFTVSTPDIFYGFGVRPINGIAANNRFSMSFRRLNASWNSVATWDVGDSTTVPNGPDKKFFAALKGSIVELTTGIVPSTSFTLNVGNANRPDDNVVLKIKWAGATARVLGLTGEHLNTTDNPGAGDGAAGYYFEYTNAGSRDAVRDSAGNTFWHDTTGGWVYLKTKGGYARKEVMEDPLFSWNEWVQQQTIAINVRLS